MKLQTFLVPFLTLAGSLPAALTVSVTNFNDFNASYYSEAFDGPWSESTAQSGADAFSIGDFGSGVPSGNSGNGFIQWLGNTPQDWSNYGEIILTGFASAANATPTMHFYMEDAEGNTSSLTTFNLPAFTGSSSVVSIPLAFGAVDESRVAFWGFTVSQGDAPDFAFAFENLEATVIPEPASMAVILSCLVIGGLYIRRRSNA